MSINNCPFCGSDNATVGEIFNYDAGFALHFVECNGCDARGPRRLTDVMAVEEWNKPGDRIKELEDGLRLIAFNDQPCWEDCKKIAAKGLTKQTKRP